MKMYFGKEKHLNEYVLFVVIDHICFNIFSTKSKEEMLIKLELLFPDMHLTTLDQTIYKEELRTELMSQLYFYMIGDVMIVENTGLNDNTTLIQLRHMFLN